MIKSPDKDVAKIASATLARSSVRELRTIRVDRSENDLKLTGSVRSFYHKQLAQEAVRSVAGGLRVVNRVDVAS